MKEFTIATYGKQQLFKILDDLLDITTPVINSESGLGKTTILKEYGSEKNYDIVITVRLSGILPDIFVGIPEKSKDGKSFDFLKLGFIKKIVQNPDKKILLFIDEINRANENIKSNLFALFEKNIDEVVYPNLHVVCAINIGDNYETWSLANDKALLSRVTNITYNPIKADAWEYFDRHNYNEVLLRILARIERLTDDNTQEEYEQQSSFRSLSKLNHVFITNNVKTPTEASKVIDRYGLAMFNRKIYAELNNTVSSMIRLEESISLTEIIKTGKIKDSNKEFEILMALKDYCLDSTNKETVLKYFGNIASLLQNKKEFVVSFIQEAKKKNKFTGAELVKFIGFLSQESKNVLKDILR